MRKNKPKLIDLVIFPTMEIRYYNDGSVTYTPWLSFPLFGINGELIRPEVVE